MLYTVLMLSVLFVLGFVGFSSKPSPIYGGLGLIMSGGVGCGMVISFGGSFLGLMVFLVYLGGMLVVFGYTTAMATEEYPEAWGSSKAVVGGMLFGVMMEGIFIYWLIQGLDSGLVGYGTGEMANWDLLSNVNEDSVRGDYMGSSAFYGIGGWLMFLAGWSLFVSIFIVIEITRGR
uniref:NADH dehydrogenase subunit 6 n=1 Tax=Rhynchocyon chrysopygus TaxID=320636 RepID=UPI002435EBB3|nr:NADH dehydrogenase subunit 6 [Rhynchocyon chrysopygus]WEW63574.1 NADH dehydrogenase subunit 6 [Rhynchocyon chrysopygus]